MTATAVESLAEKSGMWAPLRHPSLVALYFACFMSCASFGIVLPSLAPYVLALPGGSESMLAMIVSIYSVGEAVGAIWLGYLSSSPVGIKGTLILGVACGLLGSALYATASLFGSHAAPVVLLGRFAQGLWAGGAQSTQQAYVAQRLASYPDSLSLANVLINAIAVLGFTIGPALGIVFHLVDVNFGAYRIDELNAPGYFVGFCCAATIVMFVLYFPNDGGATSVALHHASMSLSEDLEQRVPLVQGHVRAHDIPISKLVLLNVIFGTQYVSFAVQEAITTPVVQKLYSWSVLQANALFSVAAILALAVFATVLAYQSIIGRVSQRAMVLSSLVLGIVGNSLIVPWTTAQALPLSRFLVGFFLGSLVTPIGRPALMSLYMSILGDLPQGFWMGILLATGATSRVIGPYLAVKGFFAFGVAAVFGVTAALFVPVTLNFLIRYSHIGEP